VTLDAGDRVDHDALAGVVEIEAVGGLDAHGGMSWMKGSGRGGGLSRAWW
jgi:hypothetical protein